MNPSIPLYIATILTCIVCSFCYIKTACFYWKPNSNPWLYSGITACIMGTLIWGCTFLNSEIHSYIIFVLAEIMILRLGTCSNTVQALSAAIASCFHTMCIKGIVIGLFALMLQKNLYQIITVPKRHMAAIIITMLLKIGAPLIYKSPKLRNSFRTLFRSENELEAVLLQHGALFVLMLFFSYNYYYNLDLIWFTIAQIILSVLMLILYYLILYYSVRISNLLENEIANTRIQEQLNDQLEQYVSYQNMITTIDDFKYHFRENMLETEALIANGSIEEAQNKLHASIPLLLERLPSKKNYSNNEQLNALLLNWDTHCQANHIHFESVVYFPIALKCKEKEILKLLAMIEDMYSYITKYSKTPAVKVEGKVIQGHFVLNVVGSIQGTVEQKNDLPYFNTPDSVQLNRLYQKIFSLSESVNGILFWNYLLKNHTFQLTFSIHQ